MNSRRAELLRLLTERSFAKRKVTLASGRESDFYIDCKQTTLHPEGLWYTGELFCNAIVESGVTFDAVAGPTLGADPIVSAIAVVSAQRKMGIPAIIVRKEPKGHGTGAYLEGVDKLGKNLQVAVFEDVVTTGGSMLKAVDRLLEAGYVVKHCFALVDRLEGGREIIEARGLSLTSLFTRADFP
jgi:orotate phosphoribosyltransferase